MLSKDIVELFNKGVRPILECKKEIERLDADPDQGMRGCLVDVRIDDDDKDNFEKCYYEFIIDFGKFEEFNRQFFHPLGLALATSIMPSGIEILSGIWDSRKDMEGIYYDIDNSDDERINRFNKNSECICNEIKKRKQFRINKIGSWIEKIPKRGK